MSAYQCLPNSIFENVKGTVSKHASAGRYVESPPIHRLILKSKGYHLPLGS